MKEIGNYSREVFVEDGNDKVVFSFEINGQGVGKAVLDFYNNFEIPFYSLTSLRVEDGFRNRRIGTNLLRKVNSFLEERKMAGVLINIIPENTDELKIVHKIYSKNGWREVIQRGTNAYVFQPKSIENTQVDRIIKFVTKNSELRSV